MTEKIVDLHQIQEAVERAWSTDTAYGDWTPDVPSLNQCAVTALIVQDLFGGQLLRCEMSDGDSHYWNRLPSGVQLDLSTPQFEHTEAQPLRETVIIRERDYVLSFPETEKRYKLLRQRTLEGMNA